MIKSNVKILFLTRLYYPHIGGIEKHIAELSKVLIKKGHSVTILTTKFDKSIENRETVHGVKIVRFLQPKIKLFGLLFTWFQLFRFRNLLKESDVIHIHDVFIWYWPFKIMYLGRKIYTTFHGQWGKFPTGLNDLIQKRIGAKLSDGVISIGEYIDKYYGFKSDIISYGAVDKNLESLSKEKTILYVGRLDQNTGLPLFLDLLKWHLPDLKKAKYKIIFCGDGELKSECATYGKVLGWQDPEPYYKKSKIVFASGYLTILEALVNRCLVFAGYSTQLQKDYYELSPFDKFISSGGDSSELWLKLETILKNPKKTPKSLEIGYNWALDQTWEKVAANYLKIWSQ